MTKLTLSLSAPASIKSAAASACALSIARCRGVFPTLSCVFNLVLIFLLGSAFGFGGGFRRREMKPVLPVVAAR